MTAAKGASAGGVRKRVVKGSEEVRVKSEEVTDNLLSDASSEARRESAGNAWEGFARPKALFILIGDPEKSKRLFGALIAFRHQRPGQFLKIEKSARKGGDKG